MEIIETLLKKFDKENKKLLRIICSFFNYKKTCIYELFFDSNLDLKITLSCHNHILSIKSYFKYFFEKSPSKIDNICEYNHPKKSKAVAYCLTCKSNICKNCLSLNHKKHVKQNFSELKIDKDFIENEFKNISKNISELIEYIKKNLNTLSKKQFNLLETLFYIYMIANISYNEYLQASKNENFSYACLINLNYIRETSAQITIKDILNLVNMEENESLFNLNKISNKDY